MFNEFRQDPVTGEWVLFAPARARRPSAHDAGILNTDKVTCAFENPQASGNAAPVLIYSHGKEVTDLKDWTLQVIPNKFPVLHAGICGPIEMKDMIAIASGSGFHELVITRDHDRHLAQFTVEETTEVIQAYLSRYRAMSADRCGEYIQIFHNHGYLSGASVYHNHSQIISMPMIPGIMQRSLEHCHAYQEKHGRALFDTLIDWERSHGNRVIYEDEHFVALCPFVSRTPYEVKIFPKRQQPYLTDITEAEIPALARVLQMVLAKINLELKNVDYTFVINASPVHHRGEAMYDAYCWHIEIMPRFSLLAGLELGTGILVNTTDPDEAAQTLRTS